MRFSGGIRSIAAGALALLASLAPAAARAQDAGRIVGTVTDAASAPLPSAQVTVVGTSRGAFTDAQGRYTIANVPAGTYEVRVQRIGQRPRTMPGVVVRAGEDTRVDVQLESSPVNLGGVVVSASRRAEKITDAPATVTRIEEPAIQNTVGNSFAPALKNVPGIDYVQVGVTGAAVNARGFNSSFNNRMLMMEDGRIAVLPENGLPVGTFTTIPKVDLAGVEVLVGPGAALYGADASNGVITLQTKDPREYPGSTIEVAGGSRSFMDVQGRHAAVFGNYGFKITGEYQRANDWENQLVYAPVTTGATVGIPEASADFDTDVMRGAAALVRYFDNGGRLEGTVGASKSNGLGPTNVGRNQLVDWQYRNYQLKYSSPTWFAQAYRTESRSGDTYQLNGFTQNQARFPALGADSIKHLSDFPASGNLTAAEVQGNRTFASLAGLRAIAGAQFRRDEVSSDRQWLVDRLTGEDIVVDQTGVYGQLEMPLGAKLRAIAAARYDDHEMYDAQFSPKAGLLFSPVPDQTLRATYNRAFKSPTVLQTSFFFPDFSPAIGLFGNKEGFTVRTAAGETVRTIAPIEPEENETWELGYKGVLANKMFVDVAGYYSTYTNFLSPLVVLNNPFATPAAGGPTFAHNGATGERIVGSTPNSPQIALTYINMAEAVIYGTDIGVRFYATPRLVLSGTASVQKLDTVKAKATDAAATVAEATAFNAPVAKWNVGADYADLLPRTSLGFTVRHMTGYEFRSGVNFGKIPTFNTLDLTLSHRLPTMQNARINVSVQNLFACASGETTADGWIASGRRAKFDAEGGGCGFNQKHIEMLNTPAMGTMVFVGLRFDR